MVNVSKILIVLLISLVIAQFSYADKLQVERVEKFVQKLNSGAAATMNNVSFGCHNPKADKPILTIKALLNCLECNYCTTQMNTFLGESFLLISEVWFKTFGSYRVNILNEYDKLVFIIDEKHQLMKPIPLPEGCS